MNIFESDLPHNSLTLLPTHDNVADDIKSHLGTLQTFTKERLNQFLIDSQSVFSDPQSSPDTIRQKAQELSHLIQASQELEKCQENFQKTQKIEKKIIEQSLNQNIELPQFRKASEQWIKDLTDYYFSAEKNVKKAQEHLTKSPSVFQQIPLYFQQSKQAFSMFFDKFTQIKLGLSLIFARAVKLPGLLSDKIDQMVDRRVLAIAETVERGKTRVYHEYRDLKKGLASIKTANQEQLNQLHNKFTDKFDTSVALFKTISNTILNTNIQVDTFIQSKIISPALTFVREKFELQNQNFKENFKENLAQQRERRQNIHVSRVKIEPKMSI